MKRIALAALALASPVDAHSTGISFLGHWQITGAVTAPWADRGTGPVDAEARRLVGKTVTFAPRRIDAPQPLACVKPHYTEHSAPPAELFQGSLTHPEQQAVALGFRTNAIITLETGCAGWIDFHFKDQQTAVFGLNDRIYTLKRIR